MAKRGRPPKYAVYCPHCGGYLYGGDKPQQQQALENLSPERRRLIEWIGTKKGWVQCFAVITLGMAIGSTGELTENMKVNFRNLLRVAEEVA
jgi:hypothetical protein